MSENLPVTIEATAANLPSVNTGRGNLARSLAVAQQKCRAVVHDKRNDYHRYNYTSSEAIISEGKEALANSGLALLPVEQALNGHSKEGESRFELVRKFLLIDQSGEAMPISVAWPVCPEKGRPLDKATAIAATLSLAYLLRDLLLMPRVDQVDDLAAREDRGPEPEPVNIEVPLADDKAAEITELLLKSVANVPTFLSFFHVNSVKELTIQQYEKAKDMLWRKIHNQNHEEKK